MDQGFTYEVVAENPERVRAELCRLWKHNLSAEDGTAEEKFQRLYREAPDPAESVFVVQAKVPDGGARPVGTMGVGVRRYQIATRSVRVGVSADLAIDREHRVLLPALRLLQAVKAFVSTHCAFAYGFPNKKAEPVMRRAGFHVLASTARYARVLRHARYASRLATREGIPPLVVRAAQNEHIGTVAGGLFDVARLAFGGIDVVRAAAAHTFAWATHFDARFDALWSSARSDYDIVGARTAAFLSWRYPAPARDIATLVRRADDSLRAYAIVQHDPETGVADIRDVFGHADALGPLLDLLLPALWLRDVPSVSVRFVGAPRVVALLRARGFDLRENGRSVLLMIGNDEDGERLMDARRWHVFNVDEDP
jgi:hypothetical protein